MAELNQGPISDMQKTHLLMSAMWIMSLAHQDKYDLGGKAYGLHPFRVGSMLLPDLDAVIVGLLHDVLEDRPAISELTLALFSEEIQDALRLLTRPKEMSYADYILRLSSNPLARKVKLADIADNLDPRRLTLAAANGHDVARLVRKYSRALATLEGFEFPDPPLAPERSEP